MSLAYLPEHAEKALFALGLAVREAKHLSYTRKTLFAQAIDLEWVNSIATHEDLAEKMNFNHCPPEYSPEASHIEAGT